VLPKSPNNKADWSKDYTLTTQETNTIKALIEQRQQGVPFAYLSGVKGFYHLRLRVE
jgi:release factor glutamine methyltransferase